MKDSAEPPYIFEWHYTPAGYFEGPIEFRHAGAQFCASNGVARAELPAECLSDAKVQRTQLHEILEQRFLARQLVAHRAFELPMPGLSRTHPDGRQDAYAFADGAVHRIFCGSADFVITDADGNIVQDTKRNRIAREARLAELLARHGSHSVVTKVLRSRRTASQDSANELVHLAEIEEAMTSYFGSERKARAALEMTKG